MAIAKKRGRKPSAAKRGRKTTTAAKKTLTTKRGRKTTTTTKGRMTTAKRGGRKMSTTTKASLRNPGISAIKEAFENGYAKATHEFSKILEAFAGSEKTSSRKAGRKTKGRGRKQAGHATMAAARKSTRGRKGSKTTVAAKKSTRGRKAGTKTAAMKAVRSKTISKGRGRPKKMA